MTPSNTELREAIKALCIKHEKSWDLAYVEALTSLFQAREQQLLTELLGESIWYQEGGSSPKRAVPVSVIQRLQNKTNDGGKT